MDTLDLRTAFYPCCGEDIEVPLQIFGGFVDRVIFCDSSLGLSEFHDSVVKKKLGAGFPKSRFICGKVVDILKIIQRIDVLFYRCDSDGEGGSGVLVLGNCILQMVLERMPIEGGLIITDGSNSRQSNFKKMTRPKGCSKFGWEMKPHHGLPVIKPPDGRSYSEDDLLHVIQVTPVIGENGPPRHFNLSEIYF